MRSLLASVLLLSAACSGNIGDDIDEPDASIGDGDGDGDDGDDPFDEETNDVDGDGVPDTQDNCPNLANANQADRDTDKVGDACDCDPDDTQVAATLVMVDALDADRQLTATAPGFPTANWSYTGGRLTQSRLADDASDAVFFNLPEALANVRVEITAASTEIANFGADDLRQLFIIARGSSSQTDFAAEACGIEVVEGLSPTQKTSTIALSGSPDLVASKVGQRTDRNLVVENEDLSIVMEIRNNSLTCKVTLDGNDVTTASMTTTLAPGAVGLFTRETRASFGGVKICSY